MITIDCTGLEDARQLHELLKKELDFPDYYGYNLDALFDCLTDIARDTTIRLEGFLELGEWRCRFANTFANAALENSCLDIILN